MEKIRTMKKTQQALLDIFKRDVELVSDVCIMHSNNLEMALKLEEDIRAMAPNLRTEIMTYIPAVAVHAGEGTVGLSWIKNTSLNSILNVAPAAFPEAVLV